MPGIFLQRKRRDRDSRPDEADIYEDPAERQSYPGHLVVQCKSIHKETAAMVVTGTQMPWKRYSLRQWGLRAPLVPW